MLPRWLRPQRPEQGTLVLPIDEYALVREIDADDVPSKEIIANEAIEPGWQRHVRNLEPPGSEVSPAQAKARRHERVLVKSRPRRLRESLGER